MEERLKKLKEKRASLEEQIKKIEKKENDKRRRLKDRKARLIGHTMLQCLEESNPVQIHTEDDLMVLLDAHIIRKADRAFLGLEPLTQPESNSSEQSADTAPAAQKPSNNQTKPLATMVKKTTAAKEVTEVSAAKTPAHSGEHPRQKNVSPKLPVKSQEEIAVEFNV